MIIKIDISALKESKWQDYAIRFVFGGLVTVATGIIAKKAGPAAAGLFLAFPAIFPASVTLVQREAAERKARKGLRGEERGKDAAADYSAGAALGSLALLLFAAWGWSFLPSYPAPLVLVSALVVWMIASGALWFGWKRFRWRR